MIDPNLLRVESPRRFLEMLKLCACVLSTRYRTVCAFFHWWTLGRIFLGDLTNPKFQGKNKQTPFVNWSTGAHRTRVVCYNSGSIQGRLFFFSTPHVKLFNFDPPDRGVCVWGVSDTVPSSKRHTNFYIKSNTGDGIESCPPPAIQNRTQGTVESRPPLLCKAEHRGR